MRLQDGMVPSALRVVLCGCLAVGAGMAQRHGGGGMAGGFRSGGISVGGGGFRGGGTMGGFRGGSFGGFHGGSFGGFRGGFGGGFHNFNGRGFGFRGFYGGYWPYYGYGYWPGYGVSYAYAPYYGYGNGYGYDPYDYPSYSYPAYSYPATNYNYGSTYVPSQPANVTVVVPPAQPSTTVIREYDQYGQEIQRNSMSGAPAASPIYLIAFKDHTIRAAISYQVEGGTLTYVTSDHRAHQTPVDTVDKAMSEQLNRERRVPFSM